MYAHRKRPLWPVLLINFTIYTVGSKRPLKVCIKIPVIAVETGMILVLLADKRVRR